MVVLMQIEGQNFIVIDSECVLYIMDWKKVQLSQHMVYMLGL